MTTTTSYGNFTSNCSDTGSAANLADYVAISLGDYGDDYDLDAIEAGYRDAINEQLEGTGITLNGDEFYGPHPHVDVDIAAAIEAVDFYEIAERHDTTNEDEDEDEGDEEATVTSDHVRELANARFGDMAVLVVDTDGAIEVFPASTAAERGARILYDADRLEDYTGGNLDEDLAVQLAADLTAELRR